MQRNVLPIHLLGKEKKKKRRKKNTRQKLPLRWLAFSFSEIQNLGVILDIYVTNFLHACMHLMLYISRFTRENPWKPFQEISSDSERQQNTRLDCISPDQFWNEIRPSEPILADHVHNSLCSICMFLLKLEYLELTALPSLKIISDLKEYLARETSNTTSNKSNQQLTLDSSSDWEAPHLTYSCQLIIAGCSVSS